jgi:hypothetical protein
MVFVENRGNQLLMRQPLETYSAYLDGHCLSDAEVEALRSWIVADGNHAIQFVEFAVLHAAITERLRLDRLLDDLASHRSGAGLSPSILASAIREIELNSPRVLEATPPPALEVEAEPSYPWLAGAAAYLAVAATLLIAAWGLWRGGADVPLPQAAPPVAVVVPALDPPEPIIPQVAARLGTSFDAKWQSGSQPLREAPLNAGTQISLLRGVAQFEMTGGAQLVVEGPSQFELTGPDGVKLSRGKASVRIADGGAAFVIDTPTMQIVDLGTEFGVETTASGAANVMVFDGVVALAEANQQDIADAVADATANGPRLEAGFEVSIAQHESVLARASAPALLANPRHFLRPDEMEVRQRALGGSEYDKRLAEHYERQRIEGLLAYQPFDPDSYGREFTIGMGAQGVTSEAGVTFVGQTASGAIDVQNGPAFIWLDTSSTSPLARSGLVKPNYRVGESGHELWLTWTTKRVGAKSDSTGSAGVSLMFGDRSDFDEPIFVGRGFGTTEELCLQSAWSGGIPPAGKRVDASLDANLGADGIQTCVVDDGAHRWLARIEFRDGADRVSIWADEDAASVDVNAPQAVIDVVDVEFDRLRLAANRDEESWRFSDFAAATDLKAIIDLKKVGDYHIDE